jgi:hypothetical protein
MGAPYDEQIGLLSRCDRSETGWPGAEFHAAARPSAKRLVADLLEDRGAALQGSGAIGRRIERKRKHVLPRIAGLRYVRQHQLRTARGAELLRSSKNRPRAGRAAQAAHHHATGAR